MIFAARDLDLDFVEAKVEEKERFKVIEPLRNTLAIPSPILSRLLLVLPSGVETEAPEEPGALSPEAGDVFFFVESPNGRLSLTLNRMVHQMMIPTPIPPRMPRTMRAALSRGECGLGSVSELEAVTSTEGSDMLNAPKFVGPVNPV